MGGHESTGGTLATSSESGAATITTATTAPESSTTGSEDPPIGFDLGAPIDLPEMPPVACPCAPNTELIHVATTDGQLWSFDPYDLEFELVADLSLVPGCATPLLFSMAVDRDGFAWLQGTGGELRTLDINNPALCNAVPFDPPTDLSIGNFGMGFVAGAKDEPCDTLFGHRVNPGIDAPGVGLLFDIDPDTTMVDDAFATDYIGAELTGTGDGRLFGFGGASPAKLIEFDRYTGVELSALPLTGLEVTNTFAFAAYRGDFYFFTVSDSDGSRSEVDHIDYDDSDDDGEQQITEVLDVVPFVGLISGAGVSTCAPVDPPAG